MSNVFESLKKLTSGETAPQAYLDGKAASMELLTNIQLAHNEKEPEFDQALFGSFTTLAVAFYHLHGKKDAERLIRASCGVALGFLKEQEAAK